MLLLCVCRIASAFILIMASVCTLENFELSYKQEICRPLQVVVLFLVRAFPRLACRQADFVIIAIMHTYMYTVNHKVNLQLPPYNCGRMNTVIIAKFQFFQKDAGSESETRCHTWTMLTASLGDLKEIRRQLVGLNVKIIAQSL